MSNYGILLEDLAEDIDEGINFLAEYLNQGALGLLLGAGASMALGFPSWNTLIINCLKEVFPSEIHNLTTNDDYKSSTDKIKKKIGEKNYLELVKKHLYEGVNFDFSLAKKDLLIALTALVTNSKTRGSVNSIITLNFDSVLEWYLLVNGLSINVSTSSNLFKKSVDVDIIHLHGYLPYSFDHGNDSAKIIMSKREFQDWNRQETIERTIMENFFKQHVFVSIGVSADSLVDDIILHFRALNVWYEKHNIKRNQPYGVALLTKLSNDQKNYLIDDGVIPYEVNKEDIPNILFKIAQVAFKKLSVR